MKTDDMSEVKSRLIYFVVSQLIIKELILMVD